MLIKTVSNNKQIIQRQVEQKDLVTAINASLDKRRQSDDGVWVPIDIRSSWDAEIKNQIAASIAYLHINKFGKRTLVCEYYGINAVGEVEAQEPRTKLQKVEEAIELIRSAGILEHDEKIEAYLAIVDGVAPKLPLDEGIRKEMEKLAEDLRKTKSAFPQVNTRFDLTAKWGGGCRAFPVGLHRRFHESIGTYKAGVSYLF